MSPFQLHTFRKILLLIVSPPQDSHGSFLTAWAGQPQMFINQGIVWAVTELNVLIIGAGALTEPCTIAWQKEVTSVAATEN